MILTTFKKIVPLICLVMVFCVEASPRTEEWLLTGDTRKVLYLAPDLGTRFIFPFNLTDEQFTPKVSFTNTSKFYSTVPDLSLGIKTFKALQNSFTVTVDREAVISLIDPRSGKITAPILGYIYLSVGRYNLTLELRPTTDIKKNIANVR